MNKLPLLIICLLTTMSIFAQENLQIKAAAAAPLGVSDAMQFDNMIVYMPGFGGSRDALEQQTVKPFMMPARQTAANGSDWSYALASCLEYYINRNRNYKDNLSPDYIALSLQSSGQRPSLEEGLKFLANTGTVSAAIMPYGATAIPNAVFATSKYRITNYLHLFREQTKARQKVFEIRKSLSRGNPVLISFAASGNFPQFRGANYRSDGRKEFIYSLLVVGFDQNRQAFEVMSCQGGDWGQGGYAWMDYNSFSSQALDGFVMVPAMY